MSGAVEGVALPAPEDLRPWGYAPGNYVFKCQNCPPDLSMHDRMSKRGDKRAWRCREHAIAARDAAPVAIEALTTPPARSYADAIEDAAKVADDYALGALEGGEPLIEATAETIAAAIRLLSQGGKA